MKEIKNLKPIHRLCVSIGEIPTSYMESMSYYETLEWLCRYLENTILPTMNELIDAYNETDEKLKAFMDELSKNIVEVATEIINEKIENGELVVSLGIDYNEETEEVDFSIVSSTASEIIETLSTLATPSEV